MKLVVGLGCDRGTSLQTLAMALNEALSSKALDPQAIIGFASIEQKKDEPAIQGLIRGMRTPITFFRAEELAQVEVPSPSETVLKYMGTPSVSEAAALLLAQADMTALLVEKYKHLGKDGKNATISIAEYRG